MKRALAWLVVGGAILARGRPAIGISAGPARAGAIARLRRIAARLRSWSIPMAP